jgi:hypothetical protein
MLVKIADNRDVSDLAGVYNQRHALFLTNITRTTSSTRAMRR